MAVRHIDHKFNKIIYLRYLSSLSRRRHAAVVEPIFPDGRVLSNHGEFLQCVGAL